GHPEPRAARSARTSASCRRPEGPSRRAACWAAPRRAAPGWGRSSGHLPLPRVLLVLGVRLPLLSRLAGGLHAGVLLGPVLLLPLRELGPVGDEHPVVRLGRVLVGAAGHQGGELLPEGLLVPRVVTGDSLPYVLDVLAVQLPGLDAVLVRLGPQRGAEDPGDPADLVLEAVRLVAAVLPAAARLAVLGLALAGSLGATLVLVLLELPENPLVAALQRLVGRADLLPRARPLGGLEPGLGALVLLRDVAVVVVVHGLVDVPLGHHHAEQPHHLALPDRLSRRGGRLLAAEELAEVHRACPSFWAAAHSDAHAMTVASQSPSRANSRGVGPSPGVVPGAGFLTDSMCLFPFLVGAEVRGRQSGPARWERQLPAGPSYIWGRAVGAERNTVTSSALGHLASTVIRQRPHMSVRPVSSRTGNRPLPSRSGLPQSLQVLVSDIRVLLVGDRPLGVLEDIPERAGSVGVSIRVVTCHHGARRTGAQVLRLDPDRKHQDDDLHHL